MIVLHLGLWERTLYLWSESIAIGDKADLASALKALGLALPGSRKKSELTAWLPAHGLQQLPSHPLIQLPQLKGYHKIHLAPFPLKARALAYDELTQLLPLVYRGSLPRLNFGADALWLAEFFSFALSLVIKENYIPGLAFRDDKWLAQWRPLPDDEQQAAFFELAQRMPPSFRCLSGDPETEPQTSSQSLAHILLEMLTDGIVRNYAIKPPAKRASSLHDAWLDALSYSDPVIRWKKEREIREFSQHLSGWSKQAALVSESPFRLCMRLVEPEGEDEAWTIEYLLQSKRDPGILIPLSLLWSQKKVDKDSLAAVGFTGIQLPLMLLGQAAGIYEPIMQSLKQTPVSNLELSRDEVWQFLTQYAQALSYMGVGLLLPAWWQKREAGSKLSLNLNVKSPKMESHAGMNLQSILSFDYRAALGDEELSLTELERLTRLKTPLVQFRGQWMYIDPSQIVHTFKFLKNQGDGEVMANDLVKIQLGAMETPAPVNEIKLEGWISNLIGELTGSKSYRKLKQPTAFQGSLRAYQLRGFSWLSFLVSWGFGACLADDMGLGKTIQALALIQRERSQGEKRPVLLVCPTSVLNNWLKEAQRFTPELSVLVQHGTSRFKNEDFIKEASAYAIVISSYGMVFRDHAFLSKLEWAGVIADEAQNIKNPDTKQARAIRNLQSGYRVALTGTPVENHVGDLWAIMEFLNPGFLGSQNSFKDRFHKQITVYQNARVADKLKKMVSPFILRRLKTDKKIIGDLPDKIETKQYCLLTKEQVNLYQTVAEEVQRKVETADGIDRKGAILAALTRLKQVCNHPTHYYQDNSQLEGRSGKVERMLELLEEILENKGRTLIFTQYREMGEMLKRILEDRFGLEAMFLHGALTRKKRDEMVERFQSGDKAPWFFILSLKAGGTGLNLTAANNVIHFDRWWNPAVENQATDRAFRIGQTQKVQVHKLIVTGTLEEKIDELITRKQEISSQVIGTGEAVLSELSNSEFKSLIALSKEARG